MEIGDLLCRQYIPFLNQDLTEETQWCPFQSFIPYVLRLRSSYDRQRGLPECSSVPSLVLSLLSQGAECSSKK